uniref:RNA-directed RNA polymerase n=1 Tax=Anthurium amnicola TaxID=1678845 RepID=A0A1D1YT17_9ARAE
MINHMMKFGGLPRHYLVGLWSPKAWQSGLKSRRWLVGRLNRFALLITGKASHSGCGAVYRFSVFCARVARAQGLPGLQLYLKACTVLFQRAVAGIPVGGHSLGVAVSVTGRGFPRIIPQDHRKRILNGDKSLVRLWLSLFMIYRIIEVRARVNVDSILEVMKSRGPREAWDSWVPVFVDMLGRQSRFFREDCSPLKFRREGSLGSVVGVPRSMKIVKPEFENSFYPMISSGPSSVDGCTAMSNMFKDACSLSRSPLAEIVIDLSRLIGFPMIERGLIGASLVDPRTLQWPLYPGVDPSVGPIGRLSFKYEPGKVRIFAMVDFWSQSLLRPIHRVLMRILGSLSVGDFRIDGTMDQGSTFQYILDSRAPAYWSFDLSAATDRFPVWAQKSMMKGLFGEEFSRLWTEVLVGRDYVFPAVRSGRAKGKYSSVLTAPYGKLVGSGPPGLGKLRYSVGQPMGAYSSWATFSLCHHALVQWASFRCTGRREWFLRYGLLGDDVVIFDRVVAREYLKLCRKLGLDISLTKSLPQSKVSFEFAKRFGLEGCDVSPLSFREFAIANQSLTAMVELASHLSKSVRLSSVLRSLGYGYRAVGSLAKLLSALPRRLRRTVVALRQPNAVYGVKHWEAWLSLQRGVGFSVLQDVAVQAAIQSIKDYYRAEVQRVLDDFKVFNKTKERIWVELYARKPDPHGIILGEDVSRVVEHSIMSRVVQRLMEVEDRTQELVAGTLSDVYGAYRALLEELEALRTVRDLYARPKARDPKFLYKELLLWERLRRVVVKAEARQDSRVVSGDPEGTPMMPVETAKVPRRPRPGYEECIF